RREAARGLSAGGIPAGPRLFGSDCSPERVAAGTGTAAGPAREGGTGMSIFSPEEKVKIARNPGRPGTADFIDALFTDFFEQRGDRFSREDGSILGGIARF